MDQEKSQHGQSNKHYIAKSVNVYRDLFLQSRNWMGLRIFPLQ